MNKINPDSMILSQLDGQWQKLFAMLLWKFSGKSKVTITAKEMAEMHREFEALGGATVFTHGHVDSIDFQIVSYEQALVIAAHDRRMSGGKQ